MTYKIVDETALRNSYPELFSINERRLAQIVKAHKILGTKVAGVEFVDASEKKSETQIEKSETKAEKPVEDLGYKYSSETGFQAKVGE